MARTADKENLPSDPEAILWRILNPDLSSLEKAKLFDILYGIRWLTKEKVRYHVWLKLKIASWLGTASDKNKIEEIAQKVDMNLWEIIKNSRCTNFEKVLSKGYYKPGELTSIYVDQVKWQLLSVMKKEVATEKKENNYSFESIEENGYEFKYSIFDSTDIELQKVKHMLRVYKAEPIVREALLLYIQGYSYEDIGEELGLSVGTVKMRIHRWRNRIRKERGVIEDERKTFKKGLPK